MKVFITGATGFIGSHLVKVLRQNGSCDIRCLVREKSNIKELEHSRVELFQGDILDRSSLDKALEGIDTIYHLAGRVFAPSIEKFFLVNVTGTKNLLEASARNNVKRFIYFSSIAAVGPNLNGYTDLDDSTICKPITSYGKSKYEAEKLIGAFALSHNIETAIIRPPMVYGPGATKCRSAKLFNMIMKKRFMFIGKGLNKINTCFIDNLIHGIMLLNKNGVTGKNKTFFFRDREVLPFDQLVHLIAKEAGVEIRGIHIPVSTAKALALIFHLLSSLFRFTPLLTSEMIGELINNWNYDFSSSRNLLGYMPKVRLTDGIKKTIKWYQHKEMTNRI